MSRRVAPAREEEKKSCLSSLIKDGEGLGSGLDWMDPGKLRNLPDETLRLTGRLTRDNLLQTGCPYLIAKAENIIRVWQW